MKKCDVLIIGAGAAGLMCAIEAAKRGRKVVVLEKTNRPGKKILMSGGGRCNFTNLNIQADCYISHNPHFCKSALSRYTPWHFIQLVEFYRIPYYEKKLGQLFCKNKSSDILEMLLAECQKYDVEIRLEQTITNIDYAEKHFFVFEKNQKYSSKSLVVATGGLSIPTLGSSPFGFKIAEQFQLKVYPTRAGLVPLTFHVEDKEQFQQLAGISLDSIVSNKSISFRENILFTHRGLSGPAVLQISSYWQPGESISINLLPEINLLELFREIRINLPDIQFNRFISEFFPKKFIQYFFDYELLQKPIKSMSGHELSEIIHQLENWTLKPNATEGYRTAEVTMGGVDCNELSSQTFEVKKVPGLYFIGEVIDVTGWLGGYNFQWAWASGWAAGQYV
jgi:predicted Rossmann fold flavoprotein